MELIKLGPALVVTATIHLRVVIGDPILPATIESLSDEELVATLQQRIHDCFQIAQNSAMPRPAVIKLMNKVRGAKIYSLTCFSLANLCRF